MMASRSACDDLVDVAGLRRQQQHAEHGAETLDRDRHGNDQLALFGDAHDGAAHAGQRVHDFGIDRAVAARRFLVERQVARLQQRLKDRGEPLAPGLLLVLDRRQVEAQHLAARIEMARIEQQVGVGIEDAGARAGRRDQPAQHRRDRSGSIGNSRSSSFGTGVMLWPACSSSSFSGSMVIELVSTDAEAEIAPAMISPCVSRLSTRASISPRGTG
jgi:hypothetical protein